MLFKKLMKPVENQILIKLIEIFELMDFHVLKPNFLITFFILCWANKIKLWNLNEYYKFNNIKMFEQQKKLLKTEKKL